MMNRDTVLNLRNKNGRLFTLDKRHLDELRRELDDFISSDEYFNSKAFAKNVMFTQEVKANNNVEGIKDEITTIEKIIEDAKSINDEERRGRIINLYKGYKYIMKGKEITPENVHELYMILSEGLLKDEDKSRMGSLYRTAPVYILNNGRLDDSMREGIETDRIPEFMKYYFDFVNNNYNFNDDSEIFIKSQIMHFYFVHIHPYFDINGRTSRTIAMWYLLNNSVYPYIIFNRGINFDSSYDKTIRLCEDISDITKFLKYMLINTKKELEKECVMRTLAQSTSRDWSAIDYQTLEYFISMKGDNKTVLDFNALYNRYNDKKKAREVFETMLLPLIEDGIINIEKETSKVMYGEQHNLLLSLNKDRLKELDTSKLSRIII